MGNNPAGVLRQTDLHLHQSPPAAPEYKKTQTFPIYHNPKQQSQQFVEKAGFKGCFTPR
jgi:hypothetical protein